jgi:hypothetical protein
VEPQDPIVALADARALLTRLNLEHAEVRRQLAEQPENRMSPALMSLHGNVDVLRRETADVASLLAGRSIAGDPATDLERLSTACKTAITGGTREEVEAHLPVHLARVNEVYRRWGVA